MSKVACVQGILNYEKFEDNSGNKEDEYLVKCVSKDSEEKPTILATGFKDAIKRVDPEAKYDLYEITNRRTRNKVIIFR